MASSIQPVPSCAITASSGQRSRSWSTSPGATTCWWTTTPSSPSTMPWCPRTSGAASSSNAGGGEAEQSAPKLLFLTRAQLMRHAAEEITEQRFPETLEVGGVAYALSYKFEPGHPLDGVTIAVPLHLLNQLDEHRCDWLVPGLLRDKISHLIRGLPKNLRKSFVPVPQYVTAVQWRSSMAPDRPLLPALSEAIQRKTGVEVPLDAWDVDDLPPHLRMNFRVVDDAGKELAMGRDLAGAARPTGVKARRQFSESARQKLERRRITAWDFGELPEQVGV